MKATRKNRGIRKPEMRLPTMLPWVITSTIANFTIVFIGYTAAGIIRVAALLAITSTYAFDSYKPVAGSIFVSITVNKNLWGCGFSKSITS
ncbi:hypothetical protein N7471_000053 [Penicillium samsonianum]|uniref:uncharacterized protein n=1 Tax=Penicillium samsonianum TaxID=1882272 RepID=UPI0025472BC7|nr:uncharacterized protein N7471_000053 [Penicillium samsonianum]KAJ6148854.1 hypothetical protein N7471_000053 [Penicillium samsonianum]